MNPAERAEYYFEAHVTIEPVFGERLALFNEIAREHKFRVADLLMVKPRTATETRSDKDSFCTARSTRYSDIRRRTIDLVVQLQLADFDVWRYKIEDTILDSREDDIFQILDRSKDELDTLSRLEEARKQYAK